MKPKRKSDFRWWLAGRLCRIACWLRGERWYVADSWHGTPGNRASELNQRIWSMTVAIDAANIEQNKEWLDDIERDLTELSQASGAAWGHIWPKKPENL